MANSGLRRMTNLRFPKRKLNPNPRVWKSVGFRICEKLSESDSAWIWIWTRSHCCWCLCVRQWEEDAGSGAETQAGWGGEAAAAAAGGQSVTVSSFPLGSSFLYCNPLVLCSFWVHSLLFAVNSRVSIQCFTTTTYSHFYVSWYS